MNPEPGTMIHIYDMSGRNVFSKTIGDFENSIDVSDLETGNYLIIISRDGSIKYKSSLIKK